MENNLSAKNRLACEMHAAISNAAGGQLEERGRGFASDREGWAGVSATAKIAVEFTEE